MSIDKIQARAKTQSVHRSYSFPEMKRSPSPARPCTCANRPLKLLLDFWPTRKISYIYRTTCATEARESRVGLDCSIWVVDLFGTLFSYGCCLEFVLHFTADLQDCRRRCGQNSSKLVQSCSDPSQPLPFVIPTSRSRI